MPAIAPEVREAATVVLLRAGRDDEPPSIFMLRRSARSTFMPDALVFPGGRVDPEDALGDPTARFEVAAKRECHEEAGLDLADKSLTWFDTWKTPSGESPRRYVARFYAAHLAAHEGKHAEADGVETEAGRWASAVEHLAAWQARDVDLPPPTLSVLLQLSRVDWSDWLAGKRPELAQPILPKIATIDNQVAVLLPHDPLYASTQGDTAVCPARALHYPARYIRRDGRWESGDAI